ncbi:Transposase [Phytophthora megakarya]|uniref:Transposase n=1 Tax=Phytophthora megakarya TaxID=4795 RepID=A0A225W6B6_9STRA|nr:Transposase [Phytophthora megakarya]
MYSADAARPHLCQQENWTCWQKYHYFYLPKKVFTVDGNLRRKSLICIAQQQIMSKPGTSISDS